MQRTPAIEAYWAAFRKAAGLDHDRYVVASMGDSPELANELVGLMLAGRKRATASLARDHEGEEPLPEVGDYVVVDGAGAPRCIWRTTAIAIKPLIEVDDAFAWDEGEGDRSRAFWLDAHRRCFAPRWLHDARSDRDGARALRPALAARGGGLIGTQTQWKYNRRENDLPEQGPWRLIIEAALRLCNRSTRTSHGCRFDRRKQ